jgi:hypothetical protein
MVSVERIGETEASIIFCLNNTHVFEYPKQANEDELAMLADIHEAWAEHLRSTPPF